MKKLHKRAPLKAISLAVATLVTACGGGGGGGSTAVGVSGQVIDGYITGAIVCLDLNSNNACDTGEPAATTGKGGAYTLTAPPGTNLSKLHVIASIPVGAIDSDSPTPITKPYTMMAPASMASVVSPLSTAVSTEMLVNGRSLADARIQARTALALPADYDFFKDHVAANDTGAHNVAKVMAAYLAANQGSDKPTNASLGTVLGLIKSSAATAYASSDVSNIVSGILVGAPTPSPAPTPTPAPGPSGDVIITFDGQPPATLTGFNGAEGSSIAIAPAGGTGLAGKILRTGGDPWAGAFVSGLNIPLTVSKDRITARVYSSTAGVPFKIKLEGGGNASAETSPTTAVVVGWQTLTWVFSGGDLRTWSQVTFLPNLGTTASVNPGETYYVDDVTIGAASSPSPSPTPTPTPSPSATQITFEPGDTSGYALVDFGGTASQLATAPSGGSGRAVQVTKGAVSTPSEAWAGTTFIDLASGEFVTPSNHIVTVRVWSPASGKVVRLKIEDKTDPNKYVEVDKLTTTANAWETLTFDATVPATAALNDAFNFNRASIFFDFNVPGNGEVYYFDEVTYGPASSPSPSPTPTPSPTPSPAPATLTFSSGFAGSARTIEGGEFGGFSGSNQDGYNCSGDPAWCGGGGDTSPTVTGANSYFYYYYQTPTPATGLYAGVYIQAPGVTGGLSGSVDTNGMQLSNQTTINFNFNPNPEWYQSSTNNFMVQFDMGTLYTVGGNPCHIQLRKVVTPTSATSAAYSLNLSGFAVVQNCAVNGLTAASVLSTQKISQVSFQAAGGGSAVGDGAATTGANLSVVAGSVYPTTLVIKGPITFQ